MNNKIVTTFKFVVLLFLLLIHYAILKTKLKYVIKKIQTLINQFSIFQTKKRFNQV